MKLILYKKAALKHNEINSWKKELKHLLHNIMENLKIVTVHKYKPDTGVLSILLKY